MKAAEQKEMRCMKVTMYIYLPKRGDRYNVIRHFAMTMGMGRLQLFDRNNQKTRGKMLAFGSLGDAMAIISQEFKRRASQRIPTEREKLKNG